MIRPMATRRRRGERGGKRPRDARRAARSGASRATPDDEAMVLRPIGVVRSTLRTRAEAPRQGFDGAPDAWLVVDPWAAEGLRGLAAGDEIVLVTWLDRARRDVLLVHPGRDPRRPLAGVFATRSPDRPNPLGLHPVTIRRIAGTRLRVGPLEAIDGTPVVDVKRALPASPARPRR